MDVPYPGLALFEYFSSFMKVAFWIFDVGFQKWFLSSTILIFCLSAVPVSLTDVTLIHFFTCFYSFNCFFFFHLFNSSLLHRHSCTHSFHFTSTFFDFLFFICFSLSFFLQCFCYSLSRCCFCLFLHPLVPPFLPQVNVFFSSHAEVKKSADSIAGWLIIALHWLQFYI